MVWVTVVRSPFEVLSEIQYLELGNSGISTNKDVFQFGLVPYSPTLDNLASGEKNLDRYLG